LKRTEEDGEMQIEDTQDRTTAAMRFTMPLAELMTEVCMPLVS
jgi:hypothetical protein